jgi:hypothetical protein
MQWMTGKENLPSVMSSQKPLASAYCRRWGVRSAGSSPVKKVNGTHFSGLEVHVIIPDLEMHTESIHERDVVTIGEV